MQNRFRRLQGDTPKGAHKFALRPPNAVIYYESATFAELKKRCSKRDQNEKTIFEKVSLTTVTHFEPPQGRLLEKSVPET